MVWNVQGSHTLKLSGGNQLTLGAGVRNLFDKRYYTRSFDDNNQGIYAGQPRTIYVQADVKF
jgi:Fe(3+) dicitrate transport protein